MIRQPAVAGQFYTGDGRRLRAELEKLIPLSSTKEKVIGVVAPHAGYMYSGAVAGELFSRVQIPRTVIILGPNHHGMGAAAALYPEGEWLTPLGTVAINSTLSALLREHASIVEEDSTAHHFEHSLEVQVPFLQFIRPDVTIVPLCLGFGDFGRCRSLGEGIAGAVKAFGEETLILASSDMTHYESADSARAKDDLAISEIEALNPEGLLRVCRTKGITMCGVVPATVMLVAALKLGASKAGLVRYATSGDVTGDNSQVVAYAAFTVS